MFLRRRGPSQIADAFRWDSRSGLLVGVYLGSIQPFVGRIARGDLHCSAMEISLIAAAPFIGNLMSPLWARQMSGRSKMAFAVWSWAAARGLFLAMLFVADPRPFVLVVSVSAIVMTIGTPAYTALMKEIYPDRLRGRLMGYIRVGLQAVALATALVVGRMLDRVSYRFVFPLGALAGIAAAWTFSRIALPRRSDASGGPDVGVLSTLRILRDDRDYRRFMAAIFVYGFGNLLAQPVYTLFQVDRLQITNTQVANMANLQSVCAIVAFFCWGRFLDARGALPTTLLSTVVVSGINVVYLLATRVEHLYLAAALAGICFAGIELSYLNATLLFSERGRIAQYQSVHSALLGLRGATAPFVGTLLAGRVGMHGAIGVSLAMIWIGIAMQHFGLKDRAGRAGRLDPALLPDPVVGASRSGSDRRMDA